MSGLGFVRATIEKDLRRCGTDWFAIFTWIAIPIFVGGLLILISGDDGDTRPQGTLLVTDEDDTVLSSAVPEVFQRGPLADMITVEMVDSDSAKEQMKAGKASGWLVIPDGFTDAFLRGESTTLRLQTNPSQQILPAILTELVHLIADAGFYIQRLFKPELRTLADLIEDVSESGQGPGTVTVALLAQAMTTKIDVLVDTLVETKITVSIAGQDGEDETPGPSLGDLFVPGLVFMALMLAASGLSEDWWQERLESTLRRHVSAPHPTWMLVAGKALAAVGILGFVALVTLSAGFAFQGLPLHLFPSAFVWLLVGGLALYLMMSFILMLAPSRQGATILANLTTLPLLMMGGSFFPLEIMPETLAAIGRWTPNGFMTSALSSYLREGALGGLWVGAGPFVLGLIAVFLLLLTKRLERFARA